MRRTPAHAVDRPALRTQLDGALSAPLSLVVASAGAGKTVLLSQWVRSHPEVPVAWVDVRSTGADALMFSRQLGVALEEAATGFRAPLSPVATAEQRLGERYLEELAMMLGDVGPLAVVFDDLDQLSGTAVLTDLWRLVDMLPPTAHFIFSSRTDLQLGWSRQRLNFGLVEIRQDALAFDTDTTAQVLEHITRRPVNEATAAAVTARTEGWAVGVQLAALTMRAAADPQRVVETMSGTDRLVVDYLSEEVLDGLTPARRTALIQLAVLDEVCSPLAEAVTGGDGEELLAELERDSLFIVPVDGRPGWYRFHRLFRDLLLLRLHAHDPHAEAQLLELAARWHLAEGDEEVAIDYLIRARAWCDVVSLILGIGREFYDGYRMATVARWLSEVPAHVRAENVDAEILLALAEGMSGRAVQAVDSLRMMLERGHLTVGQRQIALAYLAACVQFHPYPELFLTASRQALAELSAHPDAELPDLMGLTSRPLLIIVSKVSLGRALLFRGDIAGARRAIGSALKATGMAYRPYRVHALGSLALADALAGRLVEAAELADEALALATESNLLTHPSPADAYLARALIAIQRGEPQKGALALHESALRAASNQRTQLMWVCWLVSTVVEPEHGNPDHGRPTGPRPRFVRDATTALGMRRARLRSSPIPPPAPSQTWSYVAFEEIAGLLTAGRAAEARRRLTQLREKSDADAPLPEVEYEILLGWLCASEGQQGPARDHLHLALSIAELEWLVHPFVRAGPRVGELIDRLPDPGNAFRRVVVARARGAGTPSEEHVDAFTPRELELLAYLPSRLTVADIASRCYVSTNTIKTHLNHIYRKLGVQSRDAAVDRANELGLLDSYEAIPAL
jgi:LuxR family maltose regulon positive regulatory protein